MRSTKILSVTKSRCASELLGHVGLGAGAACEQGPIANAAQKTVARVGSGARLIWRDGFISSITPLLEIDHHIACPYRPREDPGTFLAIAFEGGAPDRGVTSFACGTLKSTDAQPSQFTSWPYLSATLMVAVIPALNSRKSASIPSLKITP